MYVVAASQADQLILDEADYTFQYCCGNGDDAYALMLNGFTGDVFDSSNALDIIGNEDTWQEGVGWDVAGVEQATENHTLVRKSSVIENNAGNWSLSAGTNSDNSEWIVLDMDDWTNLGLTKLMEVSTFEIDFTKIQILHISSFLRPQQTPQNTFVAQ